MILNRRQILATATAAVMTAASSARARDMAGFDAALQAAFDGAETPALGGMVVGPDGAIWTGERGVRQAGGATVGSDDLWHLGSNTKAMTAALYGRLVDMGQASWTATLGEALPDMPMDAAWTDMPVKQVMAHRGGLSDATALGQAWLMTARADPASLPDQRRTLATTMLASPPAGTPGTFGYANSNYILIGAIIERITGGSWEDAMRTELFEPLGIKTGGFGAPQGDQPWGHSGGRSIDPSGPVTDNPAALGPAGTAHISLQDYGRFLRVFLSDGAGWLKPETLAVLIQPVGEGQPPYAGGWITPPGQPWAQGVCLTHDGSNTLWYASTWVAPGIGKAFVAVSNDAQRGRPACQALIPGLIQAI
ncbi:serine hydrolase domain-containing protein [Brevundimonas sp.]|uniref:serine hydrolase domain-containing protein n=1 Tax=Brevundimonas sp. TaxID=1871086 RepID=UPI003D0BB52B